MDEQNIPQTQKSSPSSIQNQGAAHSLFFFDASRVVHHECLPKGSTVNQTYYIEVLKRLRDAIRRKRPELRRSGDWFFHHDNASALRTCEFLAKHSITVLPHPPYSPDLVPCDFFWFPMLKRPLKGRRFETIPEIRQMRRRSSRAEVESSRTSLASRTDFEVLGLGLGLEASSPRKLACPRLEDSTIFWNVKILWRA